MRRRKKRLNGVEMEKPGISKGVGRIGGGEEEEEEEGEVMNGEGEEEDGEGIEEEEGGRSKGREEQEGQEDDGKEDEDEDEDDEKDKEGQSLRRGGRSPFLLVWRWSRSWACPWTSL
eukprot:evm.model.NODE_9110_length_13470_cov_54.380699.1